MRICFIPIDNRPVCYNLAKDITAIDGDIELFIPPIEFLGSLTKPADTECILKWLAEIPQCESVILSLDTVAYGGLIPSRRSTDSFEKIKSRIDALKDIIIAKKAKIYAFSSIMRISNNNFNDEEKLYWADYGEKIFKYSYDFHKYGKANTKEIPQEILEDYLNTRKRNFEINKIYLDWQKNGIIDTLIFSKDDCAEYGLNVKEANELGILGGYIKTGADEIPLSLLARSVKKEIKVFVKYTEPDNKDLISNYEDVSVEKSVLGQLELGGFKVTDNESDADIVLIVNNFCKKQGELVMGVETQPFNKILALPQKPFAVADVRYANGADNAFVKELLTKLNKNFLGYAGWNTTANTVGSLLCCMKIAFDAKNYNDNAFKRLQMIRFLDDWAYQANIRTKINSPCNIDTLMKPYVENIAKILNYDITKKSPSFKYPWDRKFEIEIVL